MMLHRSADKYEENFQMFLRLLFIIIIILFIIMILKLYED